jgi:hypothetical protein
VGSGTKRSNGEDDEDDVEGQAQVITAALQLAAVDWGYVIFWTVFGVLCAALFGVAYWLFRRSSFKTHEDDDRS